MVIPAPFVPVDDENARLRAFFEAAPQGQLVLDVGRRIRSANSAAIRLFGFTGTGLAGRPFNELIDPASAPAIETAFLAVATRETAPPVTIQGRTASGTMFPVEVTVVRVRAARLDGFGVIARDLRTAPDPASAPAAGRAPPKYTAAELLMANRLRELV